MHILLTLTLRSINIPTYLYMCTYNYAHTHQAIKDAYKRPVNINGHSLP
jgi:hypothetical protein